jgi:hypothetical protein
MKLQESKSGAYQETSIYKEYRHFAKKSRGNGGLKTID